MYKLTNTQTIIRIADDAHIPADQDNTDYAEYLEWLAEGNTPDPSDPVVIPAEIQLDTVYKQSLGLILEYIAGKPDAPVALKDLDAAAKAVKAKTK